MQGNTLVRCGKILISLAVPAVFTLVTAVSYKSSGFPLVLYLAVCGDKMGHMPG